LVGRHETEPLEIHVHGRRENGSSIHATVPLSATVRDVENVLSDILEAPLSLQTLQGERLIPTEELITNKVFQVTPRADALGQIVVVSEIQLFLLFHFKQFKTKDLFVSTADGPVTFLGVDGEGEEGKKGGILGDKAQSIKNISKHMKGKMKKIRQSIVSKSPNGRFLHPCLFRSGDMVAIRALLRFYCWISEF